MAIMSKHGEKKLRKTGGVSKKNSKKMANKAFYLGTTREQTKGRLRKWVDSVYYNNTDSVLRLYTDKLFVFSDTGVLITIINIPQNLLKDLRNMIK